MSRLSAIVRRDAPGWLLIALGIALVILMAPGPMAPIHTENTSAGASPFLSVFSTLSTWLPSLRSKAGAIPLFDLALLWLTGLGFFYCAWRLTRNRVVSLGAGFMITVHPMAVAAVLQPAGMRDLVGMMFLAWLLAVDARPRFRSSRFPNLPPAASNKLIVALMFMGILSAPGMWIAPAILLAMDIPFHRERGRGAMERNWRSYLPHAACLVFGFSLDVIFGVGSGAAGIVGGTQGFSGIVGSVFLPGETHGVWVASFTLVLILVAAAIGLVEALFDMGSRRLTMPYVAFAGFAGIVSLAGAALTTDGRLTAGSWMAFSGFAILIPVVAWRLLMSLVPVEEDRRDHRDSCHRPSWGEVLQGVNLTPLPDLTGIPEAPRLEEWQGGVLMPADSHPVAAVDPGSPESGRSSLEGALDRLGLTLLPQEPGDSPWDADFFRRDLEPLVSAETSVLAFLPSRSPYAAAVAALSGDMVILDLAAEGNYIAVRPSGTEPKVKFYMFAFTPAEQLADLETTKTETAERLAAIEKDLAAFAESV